MMNGVPLKRVAAAVIAGLLAAAFVIVRALREDGKEDAGDAAGSGAGHAFPDKERKKQRSPAGAQPPAAEGDAPKKLSRREELPAVDPAAAYVAEGRRAILADGSFDPDFWTAFGFTAAQREATQKKWDRALWIFSHGEKRFMTEPVTAGRTMTFTIEPFPETGRVVREEQLRHFAATMPDRALQHLAAQGGLGEEDLIFGSFGRNRREYEVTQSNGNLVVHEKQYAYDEAGGWVLVLDLTSSFTGIPPRFAHLIEQARQ
jgi:hypothetical protein